MFLAAALVTSAALAQEAPPPVVNGDTTSAYGPVGALVACYNSNSCSQFCSGTLVQEKWVVTAAHCVEGMSSYDVYFVLGRDVYNNVDDYDIAKRLIGHPEYSSRNLQNDIGLVELENGITSQAPYAPNEDAVTNAWYNKELHYVGYGVTSDNSNDSGYKRYAEIPVADYDSMFIYGLDTEDEQNVCYGDSGGAALESTDGTYELAAVNSFVAGYLYSNSACVGGYTGGTRVDAQMDWITEYVDFDAGGGGTGDGGSSGDGGSGSGDGGGGDDGGEEGDDTGTDSPDRPDDDDDDDDEAVTWGDLLGCSVVPGPAFGALVLSMLALAGRRRRAA